MSYYLQGGSGGLQNGSPPAGSTFVTWDGTGQPIYRAPQSSTGSDSSPSLTQAISGLLSQQLPAPVYNNYYSSPNPSTTASTASSAPVPSTPSATSTSTGATVSPELQSTLTSLAQTMTAGNNATPQASSLLSYGNLGASRNTLGQRNFSPSAPTSALKNLSY